MFPSCLTILDMYNKVKIHEDSAMKGVPTSKGNFMFVIGTKEGKVLVYRVGTASNNKLF